MSLPLIVLAVLSVFGGFLLAKGDAFKNWLTAPAMGPFKDVPAEVPNLPIYAAVAAAAESWWGSPSYMKVFARSGLGRKPLETVAKGGAAQFGFDDAMSVNAVEGGAGLAKGMWQLVDIGLIDGIVNGAGIFAAWLGTVIRYLQTGYVRFMRW